MTSEKNNSWCVSTLDDFLHYRCPDCDFNVKMKDKDTFVTHALTEHPVSANYLGQFMIKEEFLEDKNHPTNDDENNLAESFEYSVDPEDAYYIAEEPISTDSTTPKKVNSLEYNVLSTNVRLILYIFLLHSVLNSMTPL